jgi:uncharacterized membrane protein YccC
MSDFLQLHVVLCIVLTPAFYLFAWDFYGNRYRRVVAGLTLFAPIVIPLLPFITAAALLYTLCRGIAKLIGIVAGEE